ncbi:hypothetical protein DL93DRAFT_2145062 [Clavulina sp. PMI_390]|nr:hypothetical protein DL93DRAFT_2145062 [Clavulina sp. PMI_390]
MSFVSVLILSSVLGAASFATGSLPLTISVSQKALARLSIFGTGLLLGAAIGVIIPEGVETLFEAEAASQRNASSEPPTFALAMCLLLGFIFMLGIEQFSSQLASATLPHLSGEGSLPSSISAADFELSPGPGEYISVSSRSSSGSNGVIQNKINSVLLTFGLVVHSLADGLALGASLVPTSGPEDDYEGAFGLSSLSLVVFIALILHKAPAALALTTTLIGRLPTKILRLHLALFSMATPLATIITYLVLSAFQGKPVTANQWTGKVLLFSGGTFLYVATLLSPLGSHAHGHGDASPSPSTANDADLSPWARICVIAAGMLCPAVLVGIVGHGH